MSCSQCINCESMVGAYEKYCGDCLERYPGLSQVSDFWKTYGYTWETAKSLAKEEIAAAQLEPVPEPIVATELQYNELLAQSKSRNIQLMGSYYTGQRAKKVLGLARVSPYYDDDHRDEFWFAGYDGKPVPGTDFLGSK